MKQTHTAFKKKYKNKLSFNRNRSSKVVTYSFGALFFLIFFLVNRTFFNFTMFSKRGFSIRKNKSVLVIIFIVFFIILFSVLIALSMTPFRKEEFVPNINALYTKQPSEGRNIFFLETSGIFNLNARQACAVESAGRTMFALKLLY